ncbi:hypothetical protein GI582_18230 [Sulfitobacter sp. BDSS02]|nr:hypothetical protein [Sulfitobacter sp. BDSS02]MBR9852068.1 hypothetical protein [Paracoccaceae bacterium]
MKHDDILKEAVVSIDIADATSRRKSIAPLEPLGFVKSLFRYTFLGLIGLIVLSGLAMRSIFQSKR